MTYASFSENDPFGMFGGPVGGGLTAPERSELLGVGAVGAAAGAVLGAIGTYQQVRTSKFQAKQAALAADFQASQAARNARLAEMDAQAERAAGMRQLQILGLQYGQAAGQQRVAQAASGTTTDDGSALEARVSLRLAQRIDALTIMENTARAVSARRIGAVNQRNAAAMARVSSRNLRASAGTMNEGLATFGALASGAAQAAGPLFAYSQS